MAGWAPPGSTRILVHDLHTLQCYGLHIQAKLNNMLTLVLNYAMWHHRRGIQVLSLFSDAGTSAMFLDFVLVSETAQSWLERRSVVFPSSSMPGEWQIAGQKGRRRATQHALQPLPQCAAVNSDHPQKQVHAETLEVVHKRLLAFHSAEGNAALICLQNKIEARSKDVINSAFHHNFQRLLEHLQRQQLIGSASEQCKLQGTFAWEAATDLVMYGLGSPAAGEDLLALVCTAPSCAAIWYNAMSI